MFIEGELVYKPYFTWQEGGTYFFLWKFHFRFLESINVSFNIILKELKRCVCFKIRLCLLRPYINAPDNSCVTLRKLFQTTFLNLTLKYSENVELFNHSPLDTINLRISNLKPTHPRTLLIWGFLAFYLLTLRYF